MSISDRTLEVKSEDVNFDRIASKCSASRKQRSEKDSNDFMSTVDK